MTDDPPKLPLKKIWLGLILISGFTGLGVILYATRWGAAISDDTYYYIHAARDLLAGKGLTLISNFPPGLTLSLSVIGLFGIDPLVSVRWLNAVLFGVNIILFGAIIFYITGSAFFALLGSVIFLVADALIETHSWAMSEPLFICFMLTGFLALALFKDERGWSGTILSSLFFGLAAATRYIGAAFLLALVLYWITRTTYPFIQRLFRTLVSGLMGLSPVGIYMLRNELQIGRPTNRILAWHPLDLGGFRGALGTVLIWFLPGRFVHGKEWFWLLGLCLMGIIGIAAWGLHRKRSGSGSIWTWIKSTWSALLKHDTLMPFLVLSAICYLVVLLVSRTFFDALIPMDDRLLSPVFVMGWLLLLVTLAHLWKNQVNWVRVGVGLFILAIIMVNLTRSLDTVRSYHSLGRGYASARDSISETYAYLRRKPDLPIYSNAFAAVYFWTGRDTFSIPPAADLPKMKSNLAKTGGYLVVFHSIPVELYHVTQAELTDGLVVQIELTEATIYRAP